MRRLYEICQTPMKVWKPLPTGDHNSSVVEEGYFDAIADFVANLESEGVAGKEKLVAHFSRM
jgi:hypothetical protein